MFKWISIFLLIAVIAAGVWWLGSAQREAQGSGNTAQFDFVTVDRGDIVQSIRATGRLSPVRKIQVGSQLSGIIAELHADFNSIVSKGDLIAKLETSTFEAERALAEAELRGAQAAYDLASVKEKRTRSLQERNLAASADLDASVAELAQAQAQVDIRTSRLHKAEIELQRAHIVSPTDGIVISRNVDIGQTVAASLSAPVLFEIADDLTRMEIITNVPEADVGSLREGLLVEFRVDAYRNQRFHGEVVQVRNAPITIDNVVTYDTVVRVDNRDLLLKPGMTAEVFIITHSAADVVRIPNAALRARLPGITASETARPEGVPAEARPIFVLNANGAIAALWLETGLSDGTYTEVISGVEPGLDVIRGLRLQTGNGGRERSGGSLLGGRQATF